MEIDVCSQLSVLEVSSLSTFSSGDSVSRSAVDRNPPGSVGFSRQEYWNRLPFLLVKPFKKLRQLPGDRLKKGSKCLDWLESGEGKATERSAQGPWCETSRERHSFCLDF